MTLPIKNIIMEFKSSFTLNFSIFNPFRKPVSFLLLNIYDQGLPLVSDYLAAETKTAFYWEPRDFPRNSAQVGCHCYEKCHQMEKLNFRISRVGQLVGRAVTRSSLEREV